MSRDASLTLTWADGDYVFRLGVGQLRELQEKCNCGPLEVFRRLENGGWLVDDPAHVLRLGLIGGGMGPIPALKLVRTYVEERPPLENILFAQAVLWTGLAGAHDEDVPAGQKKSGKRKNLRNSQMENGASGSSTASAAP